MNPGVLTPCELLCPKAVCSTLIAHETVYKSQRNFLVLEKALKSASLRFSTQIILWKNKLFKVSIARPSKGGRTEETILEEMNCNLGCQKEGWGRERAQNRC